MVSRPPPWLSIAVGGGVVPRRVAYDPGTLIRIIPYHHNDMAQVREIPLHNNGALGIEMSLDLVKSVGVRGVVLTSELHQEVPDYRKSMTVKHMVVTILEKSVGTARARPGDCLGKVEMPQYHGGGGHVAAPSRI